MFSLSSCGYFREKGLFLGKNRKELLLWAQQDSIRIADSLKNNVVIKDVARDAKQDSVVKPVQDKASKAARSKMYYLIIGTFGNPENAKSVAEEYSNQGYKTDIIKTTNSNGRKIELVSIKAFNNYSDAVSYRNEFHRKISSNVWIYPPQ
jgi:cell division septation protein DedD